MTFFFITIYIYHSGEDPSLVAWYHGQTLPWSIPQEQNTEGQADEDTKESEIVPKRKDISLNAEFMSLSEKIQGVGNNFSNKHDGKGEREI